MNNKRERSDAFSPDFVHNKAVRRNSESNMAEYQLRDNHILQPTSHSQPTPRNRHKDSNHSDDDYDNLFMDSQDDSFEPQLVKAPDGIELTELIQMRKTYPSIPDWIAPFAAYLSRSISNDICGEINSSLEFNFKNLMDMHKAVETVVNQKLAGFNTKIQGMCKKIEQLETAKTNLETAKNVLQSENSTLKHKLQSQEQYSRRSNLVISGIFQEHDNENLFLWFEEFAYNVLGIEKNISIERIHRIGPPPKTYNRNYGRPIMVRFSFYQDRQIVWQSKSVLSNSRVYISEDTLPEIQETRRRLWPIAKEAISQNMQATVTGDKLIVDSKQYTTDTLKDLPASLKPISISQRESTSQISFFRKWSPLSNHHPAQFTIDGKEYNCNEQFYLSQKCRTYGHDSAADEICRITDPSVMVQLAKVCKGDLRRWKNVESEVMMDGAMAKFDQNENLKRYLLSTGDKRLVEGSPYDGTWGVKLDFNDPLIENSSNWKGENKLGLCLMNVRNALRC